LGFAGGVIWAAGLVTMLKAIDYAGVAVGWALMNLSVVVSVLYGVVVLREISIKNQWRRVALGLLIAICGVGALSLSKYVMAR
jgi:glucose uptake protein GlcU